MRKSLAALFAALPHPEFGTFHTSEVPYIFETLKVLPVIRSESGDVDR